MPPSDDPTKASALLDLLLLLKTQDKPTGFQFDFLLGVMPSLSADELQELLEEIDYSDCDIHYNGDDYVWLPKNPGIEPYESEIRDKTVDF